MPAGLEGALRSGERAIEVLGARVRQAADRFPARGIVHVVVAPATAGDEFPVDVQGQAFVHVCLRDDELLIHANAGTQRRPARQSRDSAIFDGSVIR